LIILIKFLKKSDSLRILEIGLHERSYGQKSRALFLLETMHYIEPSFSSKAVEVWSSNVYSAFILLIFLPSV